MGLSEGLIRFSVGLDNNIENTYRMIRQSMDAVGIH
jgi:methionine-gamma-lyase